MGVSEYPVHLFILNEGREEQLAKGLIKTIKAAYDNTGAMERPDSRKGRGTREQRRDIRLTLTGAGL